MDKSFQLIRTNPLLTTNIKLVVSSTDSIYLESFNTNSQLSDSKFKHFTVNKNRYYEEVINTFYNNTPSSIAFDIKYDNDSSLCYKDYSNQFDTIYFSGADQVEDEWYEEEFEYFAPLYIRKNFLPTSFIILRVDDPIGYSLNNNNDFEIS